MTTATTENTARTEKRGSRVLGLVGVACAGLLVGSIAMYLMMNNKLNELIATQERANIEHQAQLETVTLERDSLSTRINELEELNNELQQIQVELEADLEEVKANIQAEEELRAEMERIAAEEAAVLEEAARIAAEEEAASQAAVQPPPPVTPSNPAPTDGGVWTGELPSGVGGAGSGQNVRDPNSLPTLDPNDPSNQGSGGYH